MRKTLLDAKRIVVKVGSALVTNNGAGLDFVMLASWAEQIAALRAQEKEIVVVSSGAIAAGMQRLNWVRRPHETHTLQAAAAVGQMGLAQAYEAAFSQHKLQTAQILLTHADLVDRLRYLNARSTLVTLLELGVVPIVNENDTVITDEIKLGDNDTLGALVANLIEADALFILTDQNGLYTSDPRKSLDAQLVQEDRADNPALEQMAGGAGTGISRGGMITKIRAAQRAARSGAHTIIAYGREPNVMNRLLQAESLGTFLHATNTPLQARKQWMADHLQVVGSLTLDMGAVKALCGGASLLPVGVKNVEGKFERGAVVDCKDENGHVLARGLCNYASVDVRRIIGKPSGQIEAILGYINEPELVHRNNMIRF